MFLLDSDIATLAFYSNPRVVDRIAAAVAQNLVFLPAATRLELLRGRIEAVIKAADAVQLLTAQQRLGQTETFLAGFHIVEFNERAAEVFEELRANKRLKKLDRGDLLNACTALAHDAMLVTRNTKDFANVPGLKLENWAD
jgi:predicted nucleic acid-binding protein